MMRRALRIGIDLGGTKIEGVVLDASRDTPHILFRERIATPQAEGYDAIIAATVSLVRKLSSSMTNLPVGVGMPGSIERRSGLVKNSNTTCLNGRPFREDLSKALGQSVVFENDANCFALAEAIHGAAKPHKTGMVFGIIMGTGVGGGIVMGGKVHAGRQGIAGEWGHHAVWAGSPEARLCYCGNRGCVEAHMSGPALEADYEQRSGIHKSLAELATLVESDPHAKASIDGLIETFGRSVANLIDILDPDAIVLGGGLSNLDILYDRGRERVASYVFNDELLTPIIKNTLGDSAGVIGAALLD